MANFGAAGWLLVLAVVSVGGADDVSTLEPSAVVGEAAAAQVTAGISKIDALMDKPQDARSVEAPPLFDATEKPSRIGERALHAVYT